MKSWLRYIDQPDQPAFCVDQHTVRITSDQPLLDKPSLLVDQPDQSTVLGRSAN